MTALLIKRYCPNRNFLTIISYLLFKELLMKRTPLRRIAGIAALIAISMTLLFSGCDASGDSDGKAVDKATLTSAISTANTAKSGVVTDTAAANVPTGTKWVTQAAMTALTNAISMATLTKIDAAPTTLTTATSASTTAKQNRIKTGSATGNITFRARIRAPPLRTAPV
jgi:hypothetical protein